MVNEGDVVGGFRIESVKDLSEKKGVGISARHEQTGLEVFHFLTDDRENFFGFVVSTPPEDDCGIPHILEHSILSASRDLPMKDAFFSMEKRSAATFMNAMTYPDATVFPAASAVQEDYYNLLEYYGGCVFFPLLREETFKTEGVRPERSGSGAFVFNGIVYNEMKGVYSQFDAAVERSVVPRFFPTALIVSNTAVIRMKFRRYLMRRFSIFTAAVTFRRISNFSFTVRCRRKSSWRFWMRKFFPG